MLRSRWPLPCLLALGLVAACTGTPPESDGAAQPPPTTDQPSDPAEPAEPEPADEAPAEPEPEAKAGPPPDPWGPVTDAQRSTMLAGDEEARIKTPIHYVKTNERRHDVWFPYLDNKRGIYVGVAADQNYTLIGVAKSEFVFLMDLDWRVTELHRAYEVLIEASEDPKTLLARFDGDNEEESVALIQEALAGQLSEDELRQCVNSWRGARETVFRHLENVIVRDRDGVATSWLSNPDYYAHIRKLYLSDRVRMLVGDLTGPQTLTTIAKAAEGLGLPVKVLYLSNAEEYYDYTSQYQANIRGLPGADDSIVLRTIYSKDWVHADALWNYQVQPLADYQARVGEPNNARRNRMLNAADKDKLIERDPDGVSGLSRVNFESLGSPAPTVTNEAPE
ncbi:LIC_10091 family protein [Enhygromyxa salina]|uniref:DUF7790 domain-containing protein n=1 Tax=Enhygromyxa salina TaxID=215803 RepID=A0A2S9YFY7_9BACT|nr:hypothetical protein [Enhygromyxa salina]PRQ04015.1 hypothetical protein ENSA7_51260 [Enhygromyxa salina]